MLNQQEKQDFKFKDHRAICTSTRGDDIRVLLASEKAVYCLKSTGVCMCVIIIHLSQLLQP